MNHLLLDKIQKVEKLAFTSKLNRFLNQPARYAFSIIFRDFWYKRNKKEISRCCKTFFDAEMEILLPSSTDIYLTGGKSHQSELNLAKFLIKHLHPDDIFLDIGAHYGYFSLLASRLVEDNGRVISFEAAPSSFSILKKNVTNIKNIQPNHLAVSDTNSTITFYEFPNLYSEYNTISPQQFQNEDWFNEYAPKEIKIPCVQLDNFLGKGIIPNMIKIDVEGAEYKALKGSAELLKEHSPIIIMEFLSDDRDNLAHVEACGLLTSLGYQSNIISNTGDISRINNVEKHLKQNLLDSDNIVFIKE